MARKLAITILVCLFLGVSTEKSAGQLLNVRRGWTQESVRRELANQFQLGVGWEPKRVATLVSLRRGEGADPEVVIETWSNVEIAAMYGSLTATYVEGVLDNAIWVCEYKEGDPGPEGFGCIICESESHAACIRYRHLTLSVARATEAFNRYDKSDVIEHDSRTLELTDKSGYLIMERDSTTITYRLVSYRFTQDRQTHSVEDLLN